MVPRKLTASEQFNEEFRLSSDFLSSLKPTNPAPDQHNRLSHQLFPNRYNGHRGWSKRRYPPGLLPLTSNPTPEDTRVTNSYVPRDLDASQDQGSNEVRS